MLETQPVAHIHTLLERVSDGVREYLQPASGLPGQSFGAPCFGALKAAAELCFWEALKDASGAAMRGTAGMPLFLLVLHTKCTIGQVPPVSCTFRSPMGASVS